MHFCDKCDNMYYIKINENNEIIYYCRNCGNEDSNMSSKNITISKTILKRGEQKYNHIINKYTKLDPTLPRINTIRCPNKDCASQGEEAEREVIYLRYDDVNMKYVYLCAICDTIWKTEQIL